MAETKDVTFQTARAENFKTVYANSAQMEVNTWDFTFIFGKVRLGSTPIPVIDQELAVVMSPQHAKVMLDVLAREVKRYEDILGEIHVEPKTTAAPEAAPSRFN